jgi:hypothetical protein
LAALWFDASDERRPALSFILKFFGQPRLEVIAGRKLKHLRPRLWVANGLSLKAAFICTRAILAAYRASR